MSFDLERAKAAVKELLAAIGEDPEREGLLDTPRRVATMYEELLVGLSEDPSPHLQLTLAEGHDEMFIFRDIPLASLCDNQLVPFMGTTHVA